ncbi:MAG: oligosaccharide flippase family protein [Erysipelotrichaceae bacterium]|jgi:O-antigen/teichoic acid export membrane protein|nr:oligosaccharide flippase family protein [Erysipelotrichaceae bacterium]
MDKSKRRQSIIAGGLISSAGIFISKLIGIIYVIPFNEILQTSENLSYYGVSYQIYSYILNVCTAGFPFAIATLVAKYSSRGDYRTSLLIKKLSSMLMMAFGFISMLFLIFVSSPLAAFLNVGGEEETAIMRNVLIVISFALFFVPILSSIRGFYQGLKEMEIYALSQVIEQISRVVFLLAASGVAVYIFHADRVWGVYYGVLAASVSAVLAIVQIKLYDRRRMKEITELSQQQRVISNDDKKSILMEMVYIAFPYLVVAVLGYSDSLINVMFLPTGLSAHGVSAADAQTIIGAVTVGINKLIAIPMILAPGFSAAIVPYITTAKTNGDGKLIQKNMRDCVDSVLYIAIPISFCLFAFAKPIYYVLFDSGASLDLTSGVLKWYSIEAFCSTLAPIFTALMMAVGLRRCNIRYQVVMMLIKLVSTYPLIVWFGIAGAVLSSMLSLGVFMLLNMMQLHRDYHVNWIYTLRKMLFMLAGVAGIAVVAWLCDMVGLKGYGVGRITALLQLAVSGSLAVLVYVGITAFFQVPQTIFHVRFQLPKRR